MICSLRCGSVPCLQGSVLNFPGCSRLCVLFDAPNGQCEGKTPAPYHGCALPRQRPYHVRALPRPRPTMAAPYHGRALPIIRTPYGAPSTPRPLGDPGTLGAQGARHVGASGARGTREPLVSIEPVRPMNDADLTLSSPRLQRPLVIRRPTLCAVSLMYARSSCLHLTRFCHPSLRPDSTLSQPV